MSVADQLIGFMKGRQESPGDSFSNATLAHHIAIQKQMLSQGYEHAEQAKRRERARWLGCGPESWCPDPCECEPCPESEEGGEEGGGVSRAVGNTFINTHINGDDALAKFSQMLTAAKEEETPDPQPVEPPPPPIVVRPEPPVTPGWLKTLLTLLAILLGALLMLLAWSLFKGDAPPAYELIAEPYLPPPPVRANT